MYDFFFPCQNNSHVLGWLVFLHILFQLIILIYRHLFIISIYIWLKNIYIYIYIQFQIARNFGLGVGLIFEDERSFLYSQWISVELSASSWINHYFIWDNKNKLNQCTVPCYVPMSDWVTCHSSHMIYFGYVHSYPAVMPRQWKRVWSHPRTTVHHTVFFLNHT